ncbi:MAG: hypothetical protein IH595_02565 [Bacteroidales bacterium]|nr:hypothetical protein [Bacteroidales bacterium]
MEQTEELTKEKKQLIFNDEIKRDVAETAKWGTFLAILGYIGVGLILLGSVIMMAVWSAISAMDHSGFLGRSKYLVIIYFIFAIIYFFPVHFLYKFSSKAKDGLRFNDQKQMTASFKNLKSLYQYTGILAIVILALYTVIIVFGVVFSSMAHQW